MIHSWNRSSFKTISPKLQTCRRSRSISNSLRAKHIWAVSAVKDMQKIEKVKQIALVLASISHTKLRFKKIGLNMHEPLYSKLCFHPFNGGAFAQVPLYIHISKSLLKESYCKKKLFQLFHPLSNAEIPSTNFHPKFLIFLPLNGIPKPQSEGPQATERTVERQEIADKAVDTETPWVGQWATSNSTLWFGGRKRTLHQSGFNTTEMR